MQCRAEDCELPVREFTGVGSKAIRYCSVACRERQNRRNQERRERYGVFGATLDDYDRLFLEQEGRCAICGSESPGRKGVTRFAFDHDHEAKEPRGLLCYLCNIGLGSFQDDPAFLRSAIAYLERYIPADDAVTPDVGATSPAMNPR